MSEKTCETCLEGKKCVYKNWDNAVCWQPKEPEQKNDFSRAEVGQELYSLEWGAVKVCDVAKTYISGKASGHRRTWGLCGKYTSESIHQDLFWRKPEIEFIPDPVRVVKKDIFVNIFECGGIVVTKYDDESTARAAENANDCKYYKTAHKITIEVEE